MRTNQRLAVMLTPPMLWACWPCGHMHFFNDKVKQRQFFIFQTLMPDCLASNDKNESCTLRNFYAAHIFGETGWGLAVLVVIINSYKKSGQCSPLFLIFIRTAPQMRCHGWTLPVRRQQSSDTWVRLVDQTWPNRHSKTTALQFVRDRRTNVS